MTSFLSDHVRKLVGVDPNAISFEALLEAIRSLSSDEASVLISGCSEAMNSRSCLQKENERISLSRILVALLPQTWNLIEKLLAKRDTRLDYEMHFSLFCYLDQVQYFPLPECTRQSVLEHVQTYLLFLESNVARAGWMAGDLLGGHWDPKEAYPVLERVLLNAATIHGELGALHGLEELLKRDDIEPSLRSAALGLLSKGQEGERGQPLN